jgi:hypothetical protein
LLFSMLDNPSFIEELRTMLRKAHLNCEDWSPIDTDDLTTDIIEFMKAQYTIETRRKRR